MISELFISVFSLVLFLKKCSGSFFSDDWVRVASLYISDLNSLNPDLLTSINSVEVFFIFEAKSASLVFSLTSSVLLTTSNSVSYTHLTLPTKA